MATIRGIGSRRSAYRVRPDSVQELDLALLEKKYKLVRGNVADIAYGGAQVEFNNDAAQQFASGDRIMLAIASERYDFDVTLWARVVAHAESADEQVVRLSFEDEEEELLKPETARFFELFNRRAKFRQMESGSESLCDATVAPEADGRESVPAFHAAVRNISNIGVSFALTAHADRALEKHGSVVLSLSLPNLVGTKLISCQMRHRTVRDDMILYGCEFDWNRTADASKVISDLIAYLLERFSNKERLVPDRRDLGA